MAHVVVINITRCGGDYNHQVLRYMTKHYISLHYMTLHDITRQQVTLHDIKDMARHEPEKEKGQRRLKHRPNLTSRLLDP